MKTSLTTKILITYLIITLMYLTGHFFIFN